jgi:hypothetical protein
MNTVSNDVNTIVQQKQVNYNVSANYYSYGRRTSVWFRTVIGALCLIALSSRFSGALAQGKSSDDVPQTVLSAFKAQYPQAQVKSAKQNKTGYKVKFMLNNKTYEAMFDQQGKWFQSVSNVSWQWHMPGTVKAGLKKSTHGSWHPYDVNFVETSSAKYYRVMVDNTNHPVDVQHQLVLTQDWEIDITPGGEVINEKYIE